MCQFGLTKLTMTRLKLNEHIESLNSHISSEDFQEMEERFLELGAGILEQAFPIVDDFLKIKITNFLSIDIVSSAFFMSNPKQFTFIYNNNEFKVKKNIVQHFFPKLKDQPSDIPYVIPFVLNNNEDAPDKFNEYEEVFTDDAFFHKEILSKFLCGSHIIINQHTIEILKFISKEENLDIPCFRQIAKVYDSFFSFYNKFEEISTIQDTLLGISVFYGTDLKIRIPFDECIQQISEMIANNETLSHDMYLLYNVISQAAYRRPKNIQYYTAIVKKLDSPKPDGFNLPIVAKFREIYFNRINHDIDTYFLRSLMLADVFTVEEIMNCAIETTNLSFKIFFAPYINDHSGPSYVDELLDRINSINDIKERNLILESFEKNRADNWKLHKFYAEEGVNDSEIATIIRNDDVEQLQIFLSNNNGINIDSTIPFSVFEHIPFLLSEPHLIQYAAFYGSINCFKYLLLSKASLEMLDLRKRTVMDYAAAGGFPEIVRICQQHDVGGLPLSSAATFYQSEVFDYFEETVIPAFDDPQAEAAFYQDALTAAIKSFNFGVIRRLFQWAGRSALYQAIAISNTIVIDALLPFSISRDTISFLFAMSSQSFDFETVTKLYNLAVSVIGKRVFNSHGHEIDQQIKYFMVTNSIKHDDDKLLKFIYDIEPIDFSQNLGVNQYDDSITLAVSYGAIRCLKYIFDQTGLGAEELEKEACPLLRIAAMYNQYEIFKFLLYFPGLNLNLTDDGGGSAFTAATWDNQIPFVKLLYQRGGVKINARGRLGETPLTGTVVQRTPKMMELLLSYPDIDCYATNKDNNTTMMLCIQKEEMDCYFTLLKCSRFDVNCSRACNDCSTAVYALKYASISLNMLNIVINTEGINLEEVYNERPIGEQLKEKADRLDSMNQGCSE